MSDQSKANIWFRLSYYQRQALRSKGYSHLNLLECPIDMLKKIIKVESVITEILALK